MVKSCKPFAKNWTQTGKGSNHRAKLLQMGMRACKERLRISHAVSQKCCPSKQVALIWFILAFAST